MHLYNLSLQKPSSINISVAGNFSGGKQQEILVSKGASLLELYRVDAETGKMNCLLSQDVFGVIRSVTPFRLIGATKDYIIIGSDSGRIVVLEYKEESNSFEKLHQETFGKTGCRRIVPGQYVASDPMGRATMICAVEKQKFVYVLNRDAEARMTISSPLEAHKNHMLTFACVGVDVGYENPIFACLEVDYTEADLETNGIDSCEKMVTYYELDLGLNHVVRRWSEVNVKEFIDKVPGGSDGPGGVLVCSEGFIEWRHQGQKAHRIPIPRRRNPLESKERDALIVSYSLFKKKGNVKNLVVKYFDSVPRSVSLNVLKTGFLFLATENGHHQNLKEAWIEPRELKNLSVVSSLESLNPIIDCKVMNLTNEETPQFYAACGKGSESSLRILRHGLEISEMAVSELPGNPIAVWTVKKSENDEFDSYIIVSFVNATVILSIGESVEEVQDSGFLNNVKTICVGRLNDDSLVQDGSIQDWKPPGKQTVQQATCNTSQIVLALSGGELVYFEMDLNGNLQEFEEKKQLNSQIISLSLGPVPEGRQRCRFVAVGSEDSTVRIFSLNPDDCLQPLSMQALSSKPCSVLLIEMFDVSHEKDGSLYLNIGLENGVFVRLTVDQITGTLSDARTRFLGPRAVRLGKVALETGNAVLALSTRPWLQYTYQNKSTICPLFYETLEYGSSISSPQCSNGIIAVAGNSLRIFVIDNLGNNFNQQSLPLKYTPRKLLFQPEFKTFVVIESDHNTLTETKKRELIKEKLTDPDDMEDENEDLINKLPEWMREATVNVHEGCHWASCLRVIHPFKGETTFLYEFENNEAAFSVANCSFHTRPGEAFLVVGTSKDTITSPRTCSSGYIYVFKYSSDGTSLDLVHKTPLEDLPLAICGFQGRLLIGMGNCLRLYDLGKKKLLRKCETKKLPNCIVSIHTQGNRIVVGDIQESLHYGLYRPDLNQFYIYADDTLPRWLTCFIPLDYDTMAAADKFGNFFVLRLPKHVAKDLDEDPSGNKLMSDKAFLQGAPHKVTITIIIHLVGTSCSFPLFGGREVLVYTTLQGAIGVFIPFVTKEDVEFFQYLEMHLRNEYPSLVGRDYLSYRSYYLPVKNVIDGELVEQYLSLPTDKKIDIAQAMERNSGDVAKKIQDMRTTVAF
ncbi:Mono-functional DNA-alkylating methyl methanesulfonate domain-containing protein [Rozella allomycis CSF55]|uniref:Mono-functional DNA-alkylating methyl methanesulfonate domain-containing protein n=1 Tax=Rozella allomycis (strain CSF55) TaxID=988480 RepID=A0A075AS63_ROZAC|nr:Mono-functional DNA-alkylating methyl methanesulfonate domain-containing protein [Rozella allomycis CSF55]|eukprot:EPZ33025.1 Mono-functional DNA-alkylating methyl methanesulfonate domain-containing protein [Rozella allomycis CSF55]